MKKICSLLLASVLLFSGAAIAQDSPERPGGAPGSGPSRPPVPKMVRDNADFQQWSTDFSAAEL